MANPKYKRWITKKGLGQIEGWAARGATDKEIYGNMGISETTFYEWLKKLPEIKEAIEKGREQYRLAQAPEIENTAYKAAKGYCVTEEWAEKRYDGEGNVVGEIRRGTKKWIKPDTAMLIFLLTNIMPDRYVNRREYNTKIEGGCIVCDGEDELEE